MTNLSPLIEMVSSSQGFELFEEKTNNSSWKSLKVRGVFQRSDSKNHNGRIYPHSVLEKALSECREALSSRNMLGEMDHPADQSPTVSLKNVSHVITELKFVGNDLIGTATVFDDPGPGGTPCGRILGALIRNDCTVGISSRGYGSVSSNYDGDRVDEYKLVTFDMVQDPSTISAYVGAVNESKTRNVHKIIKNELEKQEALKYFKTEIHSMLFNTKK